MGWLGEDEKVFACNLCEVNELEGLRETILYYLIIAGIVTVPIFGVLRNYLMGKKIVALAALFSEFVLALSFLFYSRKKIALSKLLFIASIAVMLVSLIFQNLRFMYMWFALFPAVVFILFPAKTALIFSAVFGVFIFILDFFVHYGSRGEIYFLQEMVVFYLFMVAGGFLYAKILEKQEFLLNWLISEDPLTGVITRRHFLELLDVEIPKAKRYQVPLSAVIFDIDRFREFNKAYGAEAGNKILKEMVRSIQKNIRKADVIVRWGGDEFIVYLPFTDLKGAWSVAMKLKDALSLIFKENSTIGLSVSMGLAQLNDGESKEEFLRRLEEALYVAKNRGGNVIEAV